MKEQGNNLTERFGYDAGLLNAAQQSEWLGENSDPPGDEQDERTRTIEGLMKRFIGQCCSIKSAGEH
jgi:hypothetical protein